MKRIDVDVERMGRATIVIDGPFFSVPQLHRLIDHMLIKLLAIDHVLRRRVRSILTAGHTWRNSRIRHRIEAEHALFFWVGRKLKVREELRHQRKLPSGRELHRLLDNRDRRVLFYVYGEKELAVKSYQIGRASCRERV